MGPFSLRPAAATASRAGRAQTASSPPVPGHAVVTGVAWTGAVCATSPTWGPTAPTRPVPRTAVDTACACKVSASATTTSRRRTAASCAALATAAGMASATPGSVTASWVSPARTAHRVRMEMRLTVHLSFHHQFHRPLKGSQSSASIRIPWRIFKTQVAGPRPQRWRPIRFPGDRV